MQKKNLMFVVCVVLLAAAAGSTLIYFAVTSARAAEASVYVKTVDARGKTTPTPLNVFGDPIAANVTVLNSAHQQVASFTTKGTGEFTHFLLPVGDYTFQASNNSEAVLSGVKQVHLAHGDNYVEIALT
jgi:hypothetical protein